MAHRPILHNRPELLVRRRALRAALTPAEARLWSALQRRQLAGRKFRRQHSVGPWTLDFYCPSESLAIELDGAAHDSDAASRRDEERDRWLQAHGIRTLRYENRHVMDNLEAVLKDIEARFGS